MVLTLTSGATSAVSTIRVRDWRTSGRYPPRACTHTRVTAVITSSTQTTSCSGRNSPVNSGDSSEIHPAGSRSPLSSRRLTIGAAKYAA